MDNSSLRMYSWLIAISLLSVGASPTSPMSRHLGYSTYLGGKGVSEAKAIAVDSAGSVYVTGTTDSPDFPIKDAAQTSLRTRVASFVTKLDSTGRLVYSTYLNGCEARSVAVDASGNAYVAGHAEPTIFETTEGAFQISRPHPAGFVLKLNVSGNKILYSTFLGGTSGEDEVKHIVVDQKEQIYATGVTGSEDFPITKTAFQPEYKGSYPGDHSPEGFVAKLNATGSALLYSTFLGGSRSDDATSIAIDQEGNCYITGDTNSDDFPMTARAFRGKQGDKWGGVVFVTKLNAEGSKLVYSTYLGGPDFAAAGSIAVNKAGEAFITGETFSDDFPTTPKAAFQSTGIVKGVLEAKGFVARLNRQGSALVYCTLLGKATGTEGSGIVVDSLDNAYVAGSTSSWRFPTTKDAFQRTLHGGLGQFRLGDLGLRNLDESGSSPGNVFVCVISPLGDKLIYSTYIGGWGDDGADDLAVDNSGNIYITGVAQSLGFPTSKDAIQKKRGGRKDAFFVKLLDKKVPSAKLAIPNGPRERPVESESNYGLRAAVSYVYKLTCHLSFLTVIVRSQIFGFPCQVSIGG
jgi:Beta-propeller repeat